MYEKHKIATNYNYTVFYNISATPVHTIKLDDLGRGWLSAPAFTQPVYTNIYSI